MIKPLARRHHHHNPPSIHTYIYSVEEEMIDYEDDEFSLPYPYPTLPPTPPLPSSPTSDIKMDDVHQDVHNEVCQPQSHVLPTPAQQLGPSDIKEDQQDSDDDGPPPGWESKCQSEPGLQTACQTTRQSDIKTEDVREDAQYDEDQPQSQAHPSPAPELVPSNTQVEQYDSDDDGPPPGWDPRWQSEPKIQLARPKTPQSDLKTETNDGPQDAQPESHAHSSQAPELVLSDSKMEDVQQDAQNKDNSQPQSHAHASPAPELVLSDIKVKEQDSEGNGAQPVCDFKYHPKSEAEPELQMACPTTPPLDLKMEDDQQDAHGDEGPPPGWESTPQQQSKISSNPSSPIVPSGSGTGHDQKNVNIIEESPQPPSRQGSVPPTKPQISVPKPPSTIDHHEMGQMVCGSCRRLLSYPRGARYVECACCLEENYVLEEHEVGQIICGGCSVLLMYPYGAPKVRCANCSGETEIGDQNRRLPLSEHKKRARQHLKHVQAR